MFIYIYIFYINIIKIILISSSFGLSIYLLYRHFKSIGTGAVSSPTPGPDSVLNPNACGGLLGAAVGAGTAAGIAAAATIPPGAVGTGGIRPGGIRPGAIRPGAIRPGAIRPGGI